MKVKKDNVQHSIQIELSSEEALTLFELLTRESGAIKCDHPAERKVVLRILGGLEENLTEPFLSDYEIVLNNARDVVQDEGKV